MNRKLKLKIVSSMLIGTICLYSVPVLANTKEETVYSNMNENGDVYSTIVSEKISNDNKEEFLKDITDLINIENTNGDEIFTQYENSISWKANGNDIQYKGKTEKELPISSKIKYELNGKEVEAKDIVGKDGNVKITIEYTNKEEHIVNVNGKNVKMYTPFIVVTGTVLNNENNENIKVNTGKLINNGTKTIAIGLAAPGLQESLNISKEDVEIPSKIEISMDAKDFEMNNIISYATPKVLEEGDLKIFDKLDEIYEKATELKEASKQLVDGSTELKDGSDSLREGSLRLANSSKQFNSALLTFKNGVTTANNSYSELNNGISKLNSSSEELKVGAKKVNDGTELVQQNLGKINAGASQVKGGVSKLKTGENELSNGVNQIIEGLENFEMPDVSGLTTLSGKENYAKSGFDALNSSDYITKQITANNNTINTIKQADPELQIEGNAQTVASLQALNTALQQQKTLNESIPTLLEAQVNANSEIQKNSEASSEKMEALKQYLLEVKAGIAELQKGTEDLSTGATGLSKGTEELTNSHKELVEGTNSLYEGTKILKDGTELLANGSENMKAGFNTLDKSSKALYEADVQLTKGTNTLSEGTQTLNNGANTLAEGMTKFNEEGIQTVYNYINGNLKDLDRRINALKQLAEEYKSFSGIKEEDEGKVAFITIIDSLKKENLKNEETANLDTNKENETIANETMTNNKSKKENVSE